eukprot:CAMPEP_0197659150 /NCGR_PEP_ID=MMETSP1338-20131121/46385_1 /TAXON_ID=43686 ORGANISM="Pelagodinium beii, Strain RCC1491" /NCGR_SAMPLE_ID=MMETSP1338 /ASSEMBLY_ACC=CAM_ASM_000754 /LENGTH=174 /DNA_ID=CAMNT_0043235929 /DNA_START=31 /DNA_END=556 /DNA_ORIENTATION=-
MSSLGAGGHGLTGITTNYVAWGNGRDAMIVHDKFYRGGKQSWRSSGPQEKLPRMRMPGSPSRRRSSSPKGSRNGSAVSVRASSGAQMRFSMSASALERWIQAPDHPNPPCPSLDGHPHVRAWRHSEHRPAEGLEPLHQPDQAVERVLLLELQGAIAEVWKRITACCHSPAPLKT